MSIPFVGEDELRALLPMADAIDALDASFREAPTAPPRQHVEVGGGEMLLMPATSSAGTGVKLVTINHQNPKRGLPLIHAVYVLFSPDTLQPIALFDGAELTRIRTAAVSGVATRVLARSDARRLVVFGAGVQGHAHVEAMRVVRPIEDVVFIEQGDDATPVRDADIVCTCTTSSTPVFDGRLLAPGTHVNAIGTHKPTARELDDAAVRAGRIVVETRAAALAEAGDLVIPIERGILSAEVLEELTDVIRDRPRTSDEEITVFKSVGVGFEDLAVAAAAYESYIA